jgi:hypothetical protein
MHMKAKKSVSVKAVVLLLALVLLIGCAAGGTLAWLMMKTDPIENTFSAANINITLTETANTDSDDADTTPDLWVGKLVPGTEIDKDPKVSVVAGSEACWLFVKVETAGGNVTVGSKTYGFSDFVTYSMASGWTEVPGTTGVYYRQVDADTAAAGTSYDVISGNKVSIPVTVTKAMLDLATGAKAPSLTFTAYAIQQEGFDTPAAAWIEAQKLG